MLALVLAAAATSVTPPSTVTVDFGARGKVQVPAPAAMPPFFWEATFYAPGGRSPKGDAAALKFCQHVSVMGPPPCRVLLARAGHTPLELKQGLGVVGALFWTPDGKYLVGAGTNTVRLWNLSGGVRRHTPTLAPDKLNEKIWTRSITRLWLEQGDLCVATLFDVFNTSLGYTTRSMTTTTRYAIPALRPLDTVGFPVAKNATNVQAAPCHMPHTEP